MLTCSSLHAVEDGPGLLLAVSFLVASTEGDIYALKKLVDDILNGKSEVLLCSCSFIYLLAFPANHFVAIISRCERFQ